MCLSTSGERDITGTLIMTDSRQLKTPLTELLG